MWPLNQTKDNIINRLNIRLKFPAHKGTNPETGLVWFGLYLNILNLVRDLLTETSP